MKYIIMLAIVIGLAVADFITGIVKGYVKGNLSSKKMRIGGVNKLVEIVIMLTACGIEVGMNKLGAYYDNSTISAIVGGFAAVVVFGYISIMELISLLENYAEINPDASWTIGIIRKFKVMNKDDKEDKRNGR